MSFILSILSGIWDFIKAIWNAPKDIGKIVIIAFVVGISVFIYIQGLLNKRGDAEYAKGYTKGRDSTSVAWASKYQALENARTQEDTTRTTTTRPVRPIEGRTKVPAGWISPEAIDSLKAEFDRRETDLFEQYLKATQMAEMHVDTTVGTINGLALKTVLDVWYEPDPSVREFTWMIQPQPIIIDSVAYRKAFIITETVTETNWWYVAGATVVAAVAGFLVGNQ